MALVAIAIAAVAFMQTSQADGTDRSILFQEASQAAIIARGGEISAVVALRRDAIQAAETDHLAEPWAQIIQRPVSISGGTFSLEIIDAQARFNLNNLADVYSSTSTNASVASLPIEPNVVETIAAEIQQRGPLASLGDIRRLGIDNSLIQRLAPLVTVLPRPTSINLNTASEELLTFLLGDAASAAMLIAQRKRAGFLTAADLSRMGRGIPAGAGLTSNFFWVRTTVTIGETSQTLTSLLQRVNDGSGVRVVTIGRWRGAAAPDALPLAYR
jgi:general secretion pathway protein K